MYPAEDPLFGPLQGFARILEGNEIEVNTTSMEDDVSIAPAHYWNWGIWKTGMVEVIYRGEIYPQVTEAIKQRINRLPNGQQVIVDLFGGDGEFVEELHQSALFPENSGQFHVVDSNEPSLNKARQRFAQTEVGVHSQDLTGPEDIFSGIRGKPTVVTAIGGLCTSIVTRVQGLEIARKIYEGMADGGFFIATGYTAMILNGRDFSGIGFEVEQMSIPGNVFTFRTPDQLYVLRKPAAEN